MRFGGRCVRGECFLFRWFEGRAGGPRVFRLMELGWLRASSLAFAAASIFATSFNFKGVSPLAAPADATYFCRNKSRQKCFSRNGARPAAGFPAMLGASGAC